MVSQIPAPSQGVEPSASVFLTNCFKKIITEYFLKPFFGREAADLFESIFNREAADFF